MNEDDYEMSQFVIGFDGGGGSDGNSIDGSSMDGTGGELFFGSPPPPKFLLPPPPLPDFMRASLKAKEDDCDPESTVFNLKNHLDTCDINYETIIANGGDSSAVDFFGNGLLNGRNGDLDLSTSVSTSRHYKYISLILAAVALFFLSLCVAAFLTWRRWRSRNRLGYIRKTNSFSTSTSVGRGVCHIGRRGENGGSIYHGCESSDHPLIYDDANINFISHCNGSSSATNSSSNTNPTKGCISSSTNPHQRSKNISTSLMCPSASSTSNTYLIDVPVLDKNKIPNTSLLSNGSNNLDQTILSNPLLKSQNLLESDCNSRGLENNELENRIYEEVHMNEEPSYNPYEKKYQHQCRAIPQHVCQDIFNCNQSRHQRQQNLENEYHIPLSLLPDSHPPMQQLPSTSSTLDSIKNFFNGGKNSSKSLHSKKSSRDNTRNLGGTMANLQPLLIDSHQSEPLWRYPNPENLPQRPNDSSEYSVVYQPTSSNYDKTLRISDYSQFDQNQDAIDRNKQTNRTRINANHKSNVHSLLVDSSFSSSSSCSNHHPNDHSKPFSQVPNIPSTLSTSSCSCSSSTSNHGTDGKESKTNGRVRNGKRCRSSGDHEGPCSTTTTNSSSAGSSDGNCKSSPTKMVDRNFPSNQQVINVQNEPMLMSSMNSPDQPMYHQYPINFPTHQFVPSHTMHPVNRTNNSSNSDSNGKQGIGGLFNSLWKSKKNSKAKSREEHRFTPNVITCNYCQKLTTSQQGHHQCTCGAQYDPQYQFGDARQIPLLHNMIPMRVPPLPTMQPNTPDHRRIESWQSQNQNTFDLRNLDNNADNWLDNSGNVVMPTSPKIKVDAKSRQFGTLGNNFKQRNTRGQPSFQNGSENPEPQSPFISMKQRGLTLGPSKKSQNSNRGVMPNPDDILPKEAWTDFSGNDNWPKPITVEKQCNGPGQNPKDLIRRSPQKRSSQNSASKSPIYVNMELENCNSHQNSNKNDIDKEKRVSEDLLISAVKSKPHPLPRKPSFMSNESTPIRNKNRDTRMTFGQINDNALSNELDNKDDICVNRNPSGDTEDDHSMDSMPSSTSSEEKESQNQLSLSPRRKDQVGTSYNKRGLPPLPKERKKLSLDEQEIETIAN